MNSFNKKRICFIVSFIIHTSLGLAYESLPKLNADKNKVSVSGFSSGGFMAIQFHIAHSSLIKGVGIFSAGPFYCSQNSLTFALSQCLKPEKLNHHSFLKLLIQHTKDLEKKGKIDSLSNLAGTKIFIFSGRRDTIVSPLLAEFTKCYYQNFTSLDNIKLDYFPEAGHGMVTKTYGNNCCSSRSPYINNCDYDAAQKMLEHIYGPLNPQVQPLDKNLIEFNQLEFVEEDHNTGLAKSGWIYIPKSCKAKPCKLHIFLHGCNQNTSYLNKELIENAGFNAWAESNDLIILYPQTSNMVALSLDVAKSNPNGCWDWWGYTGSDFDTQSAPQIKVLFKMVQKIISEV